MFCAFHIVLCAGPVGDGPGAAERGFLSDFSDSGLHPQVPSCIRGVLKTMCLISVGAQPLDQLARVSKLMF